MPLVPHLKQAAHSGVLLADCTLPPSRGDNSNKTPPEGLEGCPRPCHLSGAEPSGNMHIEGGGICEVIRDGRSSTSLMRIDGFLSPQISCRSPSTMVPNRHAQAMYAVLQRQRQILDSSIALDHSRHGHVPNKIHLSLASCLRKAGIPRA
jgi:hypothetical protein